MLRRLTVLALSSVCLLLAGGAAAQTPVLVVASEPTQVGEVQLAKVMADEASLWFSVRLQGRTRLALVTSQAIVEQAPGADAWLRALDYATRMRVAPPLGPLASCGNTLTWPLADSGLPESPLLLPQLPQSAASELELRRLLSDAGLGADPDAVARFARRSAPPYRMSLFEVPKSGGSSAALRLLEHGPALELPSIEVASRGSVPLTVIALARGAAQPEAGSADPSEFPVIYRAATASSDYARARAGWLVESPVRWLAEAQATSALFGRTVFPGEGQVLPVVSHYFRALSATRASACEAQVQAARAGGSRTERDYACDEADDLARSMSQLGFNDVRLSRAFGSVTSEGARYRVTNAELRNPRLVATDFDVQGCPPTDMVTLPPVVGAPPDQPTPVVEEPIETPYYGSPAYRSDGSCNLYATGSNDSCSGDSSSGDSASSDSCSGDSTSSDSSDDSCSGDSSSDSSDDSCSGDSSSDDGGPDTCTGDSSRSSSGDDCSSRDSETGSDGGCSKSEYDGDTCTGQATNSASATPRPRQVRLSLLTLLAAALALPLRRLRAWR